MMLECSVHSPIQLGIADVQPLLFKLIVIREDGKDGPIFNLVDSTGKGVQCFFKGRMHVLFFIIKISLQMKNVFSECA